jgi:pimeloyl-ACP methyl ester carboxylesterase
MADDIAALIEALDLETPFVCGWSDGGQVTLELAMRYPGLGCAYIAGAVWKEFTEVYIQSLKGFGMERPGEVDIAQFQQAMPEYAELIRDIHAPQGADYWIDLLKGSSHLWQTPLNYTDEDFKKIQEPILIVIGDRDQFIPVEDAVAMYRLIPNGELAVLPGADHSLSRTKVKEFSGVILEYLNRQALE